MARLDRLGPAKEVAQIGAVIGREFSHNLLAAVAREPEAELQSALDRLIEAGLLFRQGVPPHATYLFKHALVQDAAYGTLLRENRRTLHARIAETLESQFSEIAERQPELLARHCTEAGLIDKAAGLWAKAGQRSLERSALVEAVEQLTRALNQIATLPSTPALRREQIKLQVALISPLMHVKGYAAQETKAATERANLLIEQAEALGEPPEDHCCCFPSCTASRSRTIWHSIAMLCASSLRSSYQSPRSKERLSRSSSGIASWLMPYSSPEISPKAEHTTIRRLHITILPNIAPWRCDLMAKTLGSQLCPIGRGPCGCLAILKPRLRTLRTPSRMHGKSATLRL
jgi:hypothetical protein